MTEQEFEEGVAAVRALYPATAVIAGTGSQRPLRVAPVPIPEPFWGGGTTRLLVVFDLATYEATKPPGFLGEEWKLPGGGAPHNAQPVFTFGEAWQTFSWNFAWPAPLGVFQVVQAYLGRFDDHR
jgi:hypothetical protein